MEAIVQRLEVVAGRLEAAEARLSSRPGSATSAPTALQPLAPAPGVPAAPASPASGSTAFRTQVLPAARAFLDVSERIGGEVLASSRVFFQAFDAEAALLESFDHCKSAPSSGTLQEMVSPTAEALAAMQAVVDAGSRGAYADHNKTLAEASQALSWVVYTGPSCGLRPPPVHVDESWSAAEFYSNKVLKTFRAKDPAHVEWVSGLKKLMQTLREGIAALLKDIGSRGEGVTSGLRHVTSEMKTKNRPAPDGRVELAVARDPVKPAAARAAARAAAAATCGKAARVACEQGRRWVVENCVGDGEIVVDDTQPHQTVYVYGCSECTVQVRGKVNAISLDSCRRTALVFDSVVAVLEIVNSSKLEVQCLGTAPSLAVDATEGLQLYLEEAAAERVQITTAKCSQINVLVLPGRTDGELQEPIETPVPEQFVTSRVDGKWVTAPVAHSAA